MSGFAPSVVAAVAASGVLMIGWCAHRWSDGRARRPTSRSAVGDVPSTDAPVGDGFGRRHRRTLTWSAVAALALIVDPVLAAIVAVAAWTAPTVGRHLTAKREAAAVERSIPDAVELLVLVIRAGLTPHQAVAAMSSQAPPATRPGFAEVERRLQRGQPLADALDGLPDRLGRSLTTVADTLAIAVRHGTPIADAMEQLSIDVRHRRRRQSEAAARKLPVRLSFPLVACTLPSFVLVAIAPAVLAALSSFGETSW